MQQITDKDLPALYRTADAASIEAQKWYLRLIVTDLALVCAGAMTAGFHFADPRTGVIMAWISTIMFIFALIVIAAARALHREQHWYGGRAVAESVKTLAWRYLTRAEPYGPSLTLQEADAKLNKDLQELLNQHKALAASLGGALSYERQITDIMRSVRENSMEERKNIYLSSRIEDQRKWYGNKCKFNERRDRRYFWATAVANFAAVLAAIQLVREPGHVTELAGFFAALSLAFVTWAQTKQHASLAQSYGVAALELGIIRERASYIQTDEDLSRFVMDSENAISREHTLWLARRETL